MIFVANRTDLAVESYESVNKTAIDGVIVKEDKNITTVKVINENGARVLGNQSEHTLPIPCPRF